MDTLQWNPWIQLGNSVDIQMKDIHLTDRDNFSLFTNVSLKGITVQVKANSLEKSLSSQRNEPGLFSSALVEYLSCNPIVLGKDILTVAHNLETIPD